MKRVYLILFTLLCCFFFSFEAGAFWIWTPKTKKFTNAKRACKDSPEKQFKWAMKFFKEKDYKRAAEEFIRLADYFKDSDLAPEALYYAGLSNEEAAKYYPAFRTYQKAIDSYPFTKRIDEIIEREYNLGTILYAKHRGRLMGKELMTDLERALEIFRAVKENVPFGKYADKAQFMIGESYKKSEQYNEATKAFQAVINEYPRSPLAGKAKYELAQCTYLASLKADYDQELTDEAIEEFKSIAKTKKGLAISEEAEKAIALLEDKKAESLFNAGKFYESQKHYKSAAIYYEEILKKYPGSSFSGPARERLENVVKSIKKEG